MQDKLSNSLFVTVCPSPIAHCIRDGWHSHQFESFARIDRSDSRVVDKVRARYSGVDIRLSIVGGIAQPNQPDVRNLSPLSAHADCH